MISNWLTRLCLFFISEFSSSLQLSVQYPQFYSSLLRHLQKAKNPILKNYVNSVTIFCFTYFVTKNHSFFSRITVDQSIWYVMTKDYLFSKVRTNLSRLFIYIYYVVDDTIYVLCTYKIYNMYANTHTYIWRSYVYIATVNTGNHSENSLESLRFETRNIDSYTHSHKCYTSNFLFYFIHSSFTLASCSKLTQLPYQFRNVKFPPINKIYIYVECQITLYYQVIKVIVTITLFLPIKRSSSVVINILRL